MGESILPGCAPRFGRPALFRGFVQLLHLRRRRSRHVDERRRERGIAVHGFGCLHGCGAAGSDDLHRIRRYRCQLQGRRPPRSLGIWISADHKAHVQFPGSSPWVLAVGGTTIGDVSGLSFDEYVWNDPNTADPAQWGTTGGGVSAFFSKPSYQSAAGIPVSLYNGKTGRGVPDVAANASNNAGYSGIFEGGTASLGSGTSASSPLWAGLIAVLNGALGLNVGFVN